MASTEMSEMITRAPSSKNDVMQMMAVNKSLSICSHAMAVGDRLFIVEDASKDERFEALPSTVGALLPCFNEPQQYLFYASAPIFLSTPSLDPSVPEEKALVGRLCILDEKPRAFGPEDQALLREIARMAEDSLECEFRGLLAQKNKRIQSTLGYLTSSIDDPTVLARCDDITAALGERVDTTHHDIGPRRANLVCQSARMMMNAQSAFAIDVCAIESKRGNSTRRTSQYPQMPWLNSDSTQTSKSVSSSPSKSSFGRKGGTSAASSVSTTSLGPLDAAEAQFPSQKPGPRSPRLDFEDFILLHEGMAEISLPRLLAYDGAKEDAPKVATQAVARELQSYLRLLPSSGPSAALLPTSPGLEVRFFSAKADDTLHERDGEDRSDAGLSETSSMSSDVSPLKSILPGGTVMYGVTPVYNSDRTKVLLLVVLTFDDFIAFDDSDILFIAAMGSILSSVVVRQEAAAVARAQIRFIQQIQHELRTPLHGVLGVTEFLRQAISNEQLKAEADKTGLSGQDFLMRLLEMIRVGGRTLSGLLDDVLDFGTVSGVRNSKVGGDVQEPSAASEDVDLSILAKEVCEAELQLSEMVHRQQEISLGPEVQPSLPHVFIKIQEEVRGHVWTVPAEQLRKALSKVLANALRFTPGPGIVVLQITICETQRKDSRDGGEVDLDFLVVDTGVGMSQSFLKDGFLKPFIKQDSFTQGAGLGMTLAASLVKEIRGHLHVASRISEGTQVKMTIPAKRRGALPAQAVSKQRAAFDAVAVKRVHFHAASPTTAPDREIRNMLLRFLSARGVSEAASREDADLFVTTEEACADADSQQIQLHPDARVVLIVNANLSGAKLMPQFKGRALCVWRPPFGLQSLLQLDAFISTPQQPIQESEAPPSEEAAKKRPAPRPRAATDSEEKVEVLKFSTAGPTDDASLRGTEFKVLVVEVSSTATERRISSRVILSLSSHLQDNPINMRLLTGTLQKLGIKYDEARDGAEAVAKYIAFKPAVVLLDISLPVQDGFEACLQMRKHPLQHTPRIVAITALSSTSDQERGLHECGMDEWRTKPVSPRALSADLKHWQAAWQQAHAANAESC